MNCTTDAWAGDDNKDALIKVQARTNMRQLMEIERLDNEVLRLREVVSILSADSPIAEYLAIVGGRAVFVLGFGVGVSFALVLQWVLM